MLFLLRMDSYRTPFSLFLHIPFHRTSTITPLVFRVWEGLDWVCFGDAQSLPSVWRSSDPSAEPLVLRFMLSAP